MADYRVTFAPLAARQLDGLPGEASSALIEALRNVAARPYDGDRYDARHPPDLLTAAFGDWGLMVYQVSKRHHRVTVLELSWAAG